MKKLILTALIITSIFLVGCQRQKVVTSTTSRMTSNQTNNISPSQQPITAPTAITQSPAAPPQITPTDSPAVSADGVITIQEKTFIAQLDDIYINAEQYKGKKVRIEGYIEVSALEDGTIIYAIARNTPGCCAADGTPAALEIIWDRPLPAENSWVIGVGEITLIEYLGAPYPILELRSLDIQDTRGNDLVTP